MDISQPKQPPSFSQQQSSTASTSSTITAIHIFWDLENVNVAKGTNIASLVNNLRTRLVQPNTGSQSLFYNNYNSSYIAQFRCYADVDVLEDEVRQALNYTGVTMVDASHVRRKGKETSDKKMIVDMSMCYADYIKQQESLQRFGSSSGQPRQDIKIVLISGDGDFCYLLHNLQNRGVKLCVIVPNRDHCHHFLRDSSSLWEVIEFTSLLPVAQPIAMGMPSSITNERSEPLVAPSPSSKKKKSEKSLEKLSKSPDSHQSSSNALHLLSKSPSKSSSSKLTKSSSKALEQAASHSSILDEEGRIQFILKELKSRDRFVEVDSVGNFLMQAGYSPNGVFELLVGHPEYFFVSPPDAKQKKYCSTKQFYEANRRKVEKRIEDFGTQNNTLVYNPEAVSQTRALAIYEYLLKKYQFNAIPLSRIRDNLKNDKIDASNLRELLSFYTLLFDVSGDARNDTKVAAREITADMLQEESKKTKKKKKSKSSLVEEDQKESKGKKTKKKEKVKKASSSHSSSHNRMVESFGSFNIENSSGLLLNEDDDDYIDDEESDE